MKIKGLLCVLTVCVTALSLIVPAMGGGDGADPLVSLSYVQKIFTDKVGQSAAEKANTAAVTLKNQSDAKMNEFVAKTEGDLTYEGLVRKAVKDAVGKKLGAGGLSSATSVTLKKGEKIVCALGTKVAVIKGSPKLFGKQGEIINITRGSGGNVGTQAPDFMHYFFAHDTLEQGFEAVNDDTVLIVTGKFTKKGLVSAKNTKYAQALYDLKLFKGMDEGFALDKKADRMQGLIMLIRLFGQEGEALAHSGKTQFTDLTSWSDGHKYAGYGFDMGYTKGTNGGQTTFEPSTIMAGEIYFTYVLRALGYDDSEGDFEYAQSAQLAMEIGLVSKAEADEISTGGLYRDHLVKISYNALSAKVKGTSQTLGQKLIEQGVFSQSELNKTAQYVLSN